MLWSARWEMKAGVGPIVSSERLEARRERCMRPTGPATRVGCLAVVSRSRVFRSQTVAETGD